jgi:tRNA(Ile)-lysidine synthase
MLGAGQRIIVALSGGPDSIALTHLLRELCPREGADLVGLVHVNHSIRGAEATDDEAFCRRVAADLNLPILVDIVDVPALARARRTSLERAGHDVRYASFARALTHFGATRVATGHTLNDQAETVLLRLIRGAGGRGLGGIHPVAGQVIRPLIDVRRSNVLRYLEDSGLEFRHDSSNADPRVPRNLVRHEVLPRLAQLSPRALEALGRAAGLSRDEERYLGDVATQVAARLVQSGGGATRISCPDLAALPRAIARRVARIAVESARDPGRRRFREIGVEPIDALLSLAGGRAGRSVVLPGCRASVVGTSLILLPTGTRRPPTARNVQHHPSKGGIQLEGGPCGGLLPLSIPGSVQTAAWTVAARFTDARPTGSAPAIGRDESRAFVDADVAGARLFVRSRRPGDRFRPLGLGGRKKLQDFFVDRKVPRGERDDVPLVVDEAGRIVWVAGHVIAEEFRVTPRTTGVLLLELRRSGG